MSVTSSQTQQEEERRDRLLDWQMTRLTFNKELGGGRLIDEGYAIHTYRQEAMLSYILVKDIEEVMSKRKEAGKSTLDWEILWRGEDRGGYVFIIQVGKHIVEWEHEMNKHDDESRCFMHYTGSYTYDEEEGIDKEGGEWYYNDKRLEDVGCPKGQPWGMQLCDYLNLYKFLDERE